MGTVKVATLRPWYKDCLDVIKQLSLGLNREQQGKPCWPLKLLYSLEKSVACLDFHVDLVDPISPPAVQNDTRGINIQNI